MSDPTAASNTTPDPNEPADQSGNSRTCGRNGHRRRGWMLVGTALVIGLIGFGAGRTSSGRWHTFGMHQQLDGDAAVRRAESGINRALTRVDGTPEQKAKIADIARAAIRDLAPMRETLRGSRDKLAAALKADKVDRAAIEQLRAEQLALGETASKRATQALTDAADVLTPAQRATLIERWQRRSWRG